MQLAAAAGVEVSGGYDSTVINPITQTFGDGGLLRAAVDVQVGHRTETLRHTLAARGEFYFLGGEGRSIDQGDVLAIGRYALVWEPDDDWRLSGNAGYNYGQGALLLQRSYESAQIFLRGVFGEYAGNLELTRAFGDSARWSFYAGTNGRHTIEQPAEIPRANMLVFSGGTMASIDLGEVNTLGLTVNGEGLLVDGLGDWVGRITSFATWRHAWGERTTSVLQLGVDAMHDQTDFSRTRWNVGPYAGFQLTHAVPDANLAFTLSGRFERTSVNAVRCRALTADERTGRAVLPPGVSRTTGLLPDNTCHPTRIEAGGVGQVGGGTLQMLWRPGESHLTFAGEVSADYGVTDNFVPAPGDAMGFASNVQSVGNSNITATAGVRWQLSRGVALFGRYTFLYQHVDEPRWFPDIVRHVVFGGISVTATAGDAEFLDGIVPIEEAETAASIRNALASHTPPDANEPASGPNVFDDPLDPGAEPENPSTTTSTQPRRPSRPTTPTTDSSGESNSQADENR
jgi:hypothetical protein